MPSSLVRSPRSRQSPSTLLPEGFKENLLGRIKSLSGCLIIFTAFLSALMLASYSPLDPSWNTAGTANVHNLLGRNGALLADLLIQYVGLGSLVLPVALASWGWGIARRTSIDLFGWRVLAALIAMVCLSMASSAFSTPSPTDLHSWTGALGLLLSSPILSFLPAGIGAWLLSSMMAVCAIGTLYLACAVTLGEWHGLLLTLHDVFMRVVGGLRHAFSSIFYLVRSEHSRLRRHDDLDDAPPARDDLEDSNDEESSEYTSTEDEGSEGDGEEDGEVKPAKAKSKSTEKASRPIIKRPAASARQPRLPLQTDGDHELPPLDLLEWPNMNKAQHPTISNDAMEKNAKLLETVLGDFSVNGRILKVSPGPVVTLYELEPSPGTRASRVISLADDIARNMSARSVRVATVQGRNVIGIELPNAIRETVYLRELFSSDAYIDFKGALPLVLGKDIAGQPVITDLARMPHLLIAGTTGSGKSVAINTMILSLLYRLPPQKCRFIMIDPKMLELSVYEGIPHLLAPVVTEPKKAIMALRWTVREMEERYRAMSKLGVRNIDGYNARLRDAAKNGETLMRTVQTGFDKETGKPVYEEQPLDLTELPYIVVIVDEMADLMLVAGKEIEGAVQRLAQMARAAGIHIMMATQRPSVDVITGTIKANFPTRISFQVTSKIDSRTILGEQGAEQLLGQGDMLYMAGGGRITRVHGPFVKDDEVESIVKFLKQQGAPEYLDEVTAEDDAGFGGDGDSGDGSFGGNTSSGDGLYDKAVDIVLRERKASTSFIQRQLQLGYNKAATLIERMEREGIISPANAVGKREILGRKPDE